MRKNIFFILFILFVLSGAQAQMTFSGILDSTAVVNAGAGDSPEFTFGFEEFANIRFQARLRESGTFYGAVNLIAATGSYAAASSNSLSYFYGENYVFGFELERLYFRLNFEYIDLDAGLFRLPLGYGQVWGPSDFLNPRNPLKPDARPRGILGAALSWYPIDELKLLMYYAAPRDPFSDEGGGSHAGLSLDHHWDKASIQALYSFETPHNGSRLGVHRAGLSLKADVVIGLYLDALYTYDHDDEDFSAGAEAFKRLSAAAGADYSFFDGNLIILAEYLYNGEKSSTTYDPEKNIFGPPNKHNLYAGLTWLFNDFTNMSAAFVSSFDDLLFTPILTLNHELFQGVMLAISAQASFDRDSFFGANLSARIRLRF